MMLKEKVKVKKKKTRVTECVRRGSEVKRRAAPDLLTRDSKEGKDKDKH